MNFIFTDIDGVLFPHYSKCWSKNAINIYNRICLEFNLVPVITSTWRINNSVEELQEIFNEEGILTPIYWVTSNKNNRGLEIKEWLDNNEYDSYIVIDDIVWNIEPYVDNVFKCQAHIGLNEEIYNKIKDIYSKQKG